MHKIATSRGEAKLDHVLERVEVQRNRVVHVKLSEHESATGCDFLVSGVEIEELAPLLRQEGRRMDGSAIAGPGLETAAHVATLRLVLRDEVFPEPMARLVHVLFEETGPLAGPNLAVLERTSGPVEGTSGLWISFLVEHGRLLEHPSYLDEVAAELGRRLRRVVPFLDRFVESMQGPLDGVHLGGEEDPARVLARHMPPVYRTAEPGPWSACGLGYETCLRNLFVCSRQVVPGLGAEGEWIAAWGAAGLVADRDPAKARFRSKMRQI